MQPASPRLLMQVSADLQGMQRPQKHRLARWPEGSVLVCSLSPALPTRAGQTVAVEPATAGTAGIQAWKGMHVRPSGGQRRPQPRHRLPQVLAPCIKVSQGRQGFELAGEDPQDAAAEPRAREGWEVAQLLEGDFCAPVCSLRANNAKTKAAYGSREGWQRFAQ